MCIYLKLSLSIEQLQLINAFWHSLAEKSSSATYKTVTFSQSQKLLSLRKSGNKVYNAYSSDYNPASSSELPQL